MNKEISQDFMDSVKPIAISEMQKESVEKFRTMIYLPKKSCPLFILLYTSIAIVFIAASTVCFDPLLPEYRLAYYITILPILLVYGIFTVVAAERMKNRKVVTAIYEHQDSMSGLMMVTEDSNAVIFYGKKANVHSRGDTVRIANRAIMYADGVTNQEFDDIAAASKKIDLFFYRSSDGRSLRLVNVFASNNMEEVHEKEEG